MVFSDAAALLNRDSVRTLVANFADPQVGAVSGKYVVVKADEVDIGKSEDVYWRYETFLKVMESEISGLADLHAYMKYENFVTRFSFPYLDVPVVASEFELRETPEDKLPYDPKNVRGGRQEASPAELKQEPKGSPPPQTKDPRMQHQEPSVAVDANGQQSLILRG